MSGFKVSPINSLILSKVRDAIKSESIKLWLEPYTLTNSDAAFDELSESMSLKLNLCKEDIFLCLKSLQKHSIEKLQQNNKFKNEGIATLSLKISPYDESNQIKFIETKLDITVEEFAENVKTKLQLTALHSVRKVVYSGKILNMKKTLKDQSVQHNKPILCMIETSSEVTKMKETEKMMEEFKRTRRGAELFAGTSTSYDAQITDQNGRTIDLPNSEKESLVLALSIHKHGQVFLKSKEYKNALILLLEADEEYKKCRGTILKVVDNYAILQLDISWCYLRMKNLDALPDVSERLNMSEESFNKTYGSNLQRLYALKGSTGEEIAQFVRLYTLQGVAAFHKNQFDLSKQFLKKAQGYCSALEIDEKDLVEMLQLGFDSEESKKALRASNNVLAKAIQFAFEKREEQQKIEKEESIKDERRLLKMKLGKCSNGEYVDIDAYNNIVTNLGYDKKIVKVALKKYNNDIVQAIQALQTEPDVLLKASSKKSVSSILKAQLLSLGWNDQLIKHCQDILKDDFEKILEGLLADDTEKGMMLKQILSQQINTPSSSNSDKTDDLKLWLKLNGEKLNPELKNLLQKLKSSISSKIHDEECMKNLAKSLNDQTTYDDKLSLIEETEYINEYLALLISL